MPATEARSKLDPPVRIEREHTGSGGRWVAIHGERGRVTCEIGTTGNSLDPNRRVRLSRTEFLATRDGLAVYTRWPVAEKVTHRAVQIIDDLRGELREAEDPDPDGMLADIAELLTETPGPESDLAAAILISAYPLLDRPVDLGARPAEIPVAVESLLRHRTPRAAVTRTLMPSSATRPLVRALATALLPDDNGTIAWERVLLALMAAPRCGPEQLTSILTARVHHPGAVSFSLNDVQRARWMLAERHPRRVAETLRAALEQSGGTAELAREIAAFGYRPPPPPPQSDRAVPRRAEPAPTPEHDPGQVRIKHPVALREIENAEIAGLRVCLPSVPDDLLEWGLEMSNCLGAYRGALILRRTHIIGFSRTQGSLLNAGNRLEIVAEVSPHRVLRQLEAPHNTAPPPRIGEEIVAFLREHRVVEADGRTA